LKDISGSLDHETRLRVADTLKEFENDTPPPTTQVPASSQDTRGKEYSLSEEREFESHALDEDQVSASVGLNDSLDVLEEDFLSDQRSSESGFMGRNAQIQWMRTLQRKLDQPETGPFEPPHAPPGSSTEAFLQRSEALRERRRHSVDKMPLSDYYFYLDNTRIDTSIADPDAVPSAERATFLLEVYRANVHNPFRILDDAFLDQLAISFQKSWHNESKMLPAKWKGILHLVFATTSNFLHLNGSELRGHDRDHHEYVARAMHFLDLERFATLISGPSLWLIQVSSFHGDCCLNLTHVA
jgi:hypothetical protein